MDKGSKLAIVFPLDLLAVYTFLFHQHFPTPLPINYNCQMEYGPINHKLTFILIITELLSILVRSAGARQRKGNKTVILATRLVALLSRIKFWENCCEIAWLNAAL